LLDVVRKWRPTVLIGLSGVARSFNEEIVREMARHVDRPVILPSSNPSSISEATPADLFAWTDCRCLVATGSPFPQVECGGRVYRVGQGNNVFIFPGLGLAAIAANATRITDSMTKAASEALAKQVTQEERDAGLLFPAVSRLRTVSFEIAVAVAHQAIQDGVAAVEHDDVERLVREARWSPDYQDYVPA
jgi:malate dehydrogenase (oxaloacetate-decarboxylating)